MCPFLIFFGGVVTLFVFACYSDIFWLFSMLFLNSALEMGCHFTGGATVTTFWHWPKRNSKRTWNQHHASSSPGSPANMLLGMVLSCFIMFYYVFLWSLFRCWWYFNFMIVYSCVIFWSVGTWSQLFFSKVKHNFCLTSFCPGGASQCSDLSRSWRNRTWALGRVQISLWQRSTWEVVGMEFL